MLWPFFCLFSCFIIKVLVIIDARPSFCLISPHDNHYFIVLKAIEVLAEDSACPYLNKKTTKIGNITNPIRNSHTASQPSSYLDNRLVKLTKAL